MKEKHEEDNTRMFACLAAYLVILFMIIGTIPAWL